jgi:ribosome-binding factor A
MQNQRIKSANINLRDEIAAIINRELEFNDVLVTVTSAEISKDLKNLKVYISVLPQEKLQSVLKELRKNIFHLSKNLNKKIKIKQMPKIKFFKDEGHANYLQIEDIITALK